MTSDNAAQGVFKCVWAIYKKLIEEIKTGGGSIVFVSSDGSSSPTSSASDHDQLGVNLKLINIGCSAFEDTKDSLKKEHIKQYLSASLSPEASTAMTTAEPIYYKRGYRAPVAASYSSVSSTKAKTHKTDTSQSPTSQNKVFGKTTTISHDKGLSNTDLSTTKGDKGSSKAVYSSQQEEQFLVSQFGHLDTATLMELPPAVRKEVLMVSKRVKRHRKGKNHISSPLPYSAQMGKKKVKTAVAVNGNGHSSSKPPVSNLVDEAQIDSFFGV